MTRVHTRSAMRWADLFFFHNLASNPLRLAAGLAAITLIAASAAVGTMVGHLLGSQYGPTLALVFAAVAIAGELLKPIAVLATWQSIRRLRLANAAVCGVVAAVCLSYSLAADLYLSSRVRGDAAAERVQATVALENARADRARLIDRLSDLRPVAAIDDQIDELLRTDGANRCLHVDGPISRRVCDRVAELTAERERNVAARDRLEQQISSGSKRIRELGEQATGYADPLATAVSRYLDALGVARISPTDVSPWLALLLPTLLEIGSSFGLIVASSIGIDRVPPVSRSSELASQASDENSGETSIDRSIGAALLMHVRSKGGALYAGQRELAAALGTSKSVLHRVLHQLENDGRIALSASNRGTQIKLMESTNA